MAASRARAAGGKIGDYLGQPLASPLAIKGAYLLILASDGRDHEVLVEAANTARRNASGSAYTL